MTPRRSLLEGTTPSKSEIIAVCDFIEQVGKKEGWKPGDQALRAVRYLRAFAKENEELRADSALLGAATFLIEQAVLDPTLPGFLGEAITHLMRVYALHPDHPDPERATAILEREG